jgi:hypothetical protein
MSVAKMFQDFLTNLKVDNDEQISQRYGEITAALNKQFRDTESKTANSLQVGSYGRWTAIKGVSDLDMIYIMPKGAWSDYDGKQSKLLEDTKSAIKSRYPRTDIYVDRLVVRVLYTNFHVEVQPVFEQDDGSFKYPDAYNGGSWKITKPREEIAAMTEFEAEKNKNLRRLCKMARAWKNKHSVGIGGLLIDTLVYNFLKSTSDYDNKSYLYYDWMSRDFFKYLSELPDQDYFAALGSGQRVRVKEKFQKKAKKTYELCLKAIDAENSENVNAKWKKVYGRPFPAGKDANKNESAAKADYRWENTEQFIDFRFPVDIRNSIKIECDVLQDGFRQASLRTMLFQKARLKPKKTLKFHVENHNIEGSFDLYWKVLNRGEEAQRRNQVRGQIIPDAGYMRREERTSFNGEHIVECYAVKNGVVVASDRIHVPIEGSSDD